MAPDRFGRVITTIVVAATAAASAYLLAMGLLDPGRLAPGAGEPAARLLGSYQAVRTVILVGALVALLLWRAWGPLRLLLILNALAQLGDVVVAAVHHRPPAQMLGPLCFAVALAYAAYRLAGPRPRRASGRVSDPRRTALLFGAPRFKRSPR